MKPTGGIPRPREVRAAYEPVAGALDARSGPRFSCIVVHRLGWMLVVSSLMAACARPRSAPADAGAETAAVVAPGDGELPLEASLLCSATEPGRLAELRQRLVCSQAGHAAHCEALDAFAKGVPAEGPIGPLAGRSLTILRSQFQEAAVEVQVKDRRGELDVLRWVDVTGRTNPDAEMASFLARLSMGKAPSSDDPVVVRARALRLHADAGEARRLCGSLVILDNAPVFVREAAGSIIGVRIIRGVEEFEVAIFRK